MSATENTATRMVGAEWIHNEGDAVTLSVTRCTVCGATWFPPREVCSSCASPQTVDGRSDADGVVYASTRVHIGPPGFTPPYVLSYVDIGAIRLLAHTRSAQPLPPGIPVRLDIGPAGADGALSSYVVVPTDGGQR